MLVSYVHSFVSNPGIRWDIWGGVPPDLRPLYTASMLGAAVGFFPFTSFILLKAEPSWFRRRPDGGYCVFVALYALVLVASAAWMPLTYRMIEAPSGELWLAIRIVLGGVAVSALGLLLALLKSEQRQPRRWYRAALVGCVLFCWQTVVLDAIVWPYYFPLQA
ncbi:MAG: hypothetical protein JXA58_07675 [Dehalococcoidia bacterium]|nr:hypothetical protein [Dehalococcoidia bacterium]